MKKSRLELQHEQVQKDIANLPEDKKRIVMDQKAQVEAEIESFNNDVFDFESEARMREAGYLPSQVEDMAKFMKKNNIQVGQLFSFNGKLKVLTPFKTVVDGQNYVTALQDRLFEITTVDQEIMVSQLKTQVQEFTSLSFLGLIALSFKRLYNNLFKGKNNG